MPFIPGGFAHVILSVRHVSLSRAAAVTWGVGASLVPSQSVAEDIVSDFTSNLDDNFDNQVTLGPATVYFGNAFLGSLPFDVAAEVPGLRAIDSPAPAVAVLVRKTTATPGRVGRGRMYLPWCVADTEVSETGIVTAGIQTAIDADLLQWQTAASSAGRPLFLLHSQATPSQPPPSQLTALLTQNIVASQRRRQTR